MNPNNIDVGENTIISENNDHELSIPLLQSCNNLEEKKELYEILFTTQEIQTYRSRLHKWGEKLNIIFGIKVYDYETAKNIYDSMPDFTNDDNETYEFNFTKKKNKFTKLWTPFFLPNHSRLIYRQIHAYESEETQKQKLSSLKIKHNSEDNIILPIQFQLIQNINISMMQRIRIVEIFDQRFSDKISYILGSNIDSLPNENSESSLPSELIEHNDEFLNTLFNNTHIILISNSKFNDNSIMNTRFFIKNIDVRRIAVLSNVYLRYKEISLDTLNAFFNIKEGSPSLIKTQYSFDNSIYGYDEIERSVLNVNRSLNRKNYIGNFDTIETLKNQPIWFSVLINSDFLDDFNFSLSNNILESIINIERNKFIYVINHDKQILAVTYDDMVQVLGYDFLSLKNYNKSNPLVKLKIYKQNIVIYNALDDSACNKNYTQSIIDDMILNSEFTKYNSSFKIHENDDNFYSGITHEQCEDVNFNTNKHLGILFKENASMRQVIMFSNVYHVHIINSLEEIDNDVFDRITMEKEILIDFDIMQRVIKQSYFILRTIPDKICSPMLLEYIKTQTDLIKKDPDILNGHNLRLNQLINNESLGKSQEEIIKDYCSFLTDNESAKSLYTKNVIIYLRIFNKEGRYQFKYFFKTHFYNLNYLINFYTIILDRANRHFKHELSYSSKCNIQYDIFALQHRINLITCIKEMLFSLTEKVKYNRKKHIFSLQDMELLRQYKSFLENLFVVKRIDDHVNGKDTVRFSKLITGEKLIKLINNDINNYSNYIDSLMEKQLTHIIKKDYEIINNLNYNSTLINTNYLKTKLIMKITNFNNFTNTSSIILNFEKFLIENTNFIKTKQLQDLNYCYYNSYYEKTHNSKLVINAHGFDPNYITHEEAIKYQLSFAQNASLLQGDYYKQFLLQSDYIKTNIIKALNNQNNFHFVGNDYKSNCHAYYSLLLLLEQINQMKENNNFIYTGQITFELNPVTGVIQSVAEKIDVLLNKINLQKPIIFNGIYDTINKESLIGHTLSVHFGKEHINVAKSRIIVCFYDGATLIEYKLGVILPKAASVIDRKHCHALVLNNVRHLSKVVEILWGEEFLINPFLNELELLEVAEIHPFRRFNQFFKLPVNITKQQWEDEDFVSENAIFSPPKLDGRFQELDLFPKKLVSTFIPEINQENEQYYLHTIMSDQDTISDKRYNSVKHFELKRVLPFSRQIGLMNDIINENIITIPSTSSVQVNQSNNKTKKQKGESRIKRKSLKAKAISTINEKEKTKIDEQRNISNTSHNNALLHCQHENSDSSSSSDSVTRKTKSNKQKKSYSEIQEIKKIDVLEQEMKKTIFNRMELCNKLNSKLKRKNNNPEYPDEHNKKHKK